MIIAGLMTGTSADGLDLVLAEFTLDPDTIPNSAIDTIPNSAPTLAVRILAEREVPFDASLHSDILRLLEPRDLPLSLVSDVDGRLGRFFAEAAAAFCRDTGITPDLVVSHGQTVRHDITEGLVTSTLQLGQPAFLAEAVGAPVLSDVRARDVAAGGQGAPLVGILDGLLLGEVETPTALLNLGGIANITVIFPGKDPIAFDTGPANALIDILARRITGGRESFDRNGEFAAAGTVDEGLLADLLAEPYYSRPAPKSTGKELFHAEYLDGFLAAHPHLGEHDAIATVTALTARTVAEACRAHGVTTAIASGGGTRNPVLMRELGHHLGAGADGGPGSGAGPGTGPGDGPSTGPGAGAGTVLRTTDEALGLPEGSKEALLMALLGWLSWHGLTGTEPSLTGAAHPSIAGRFTPGRGGLRLPEPLRTRPTRLRILP